MIECPYSQGGVPMPKMTTCLWFDTEAEEAARFYCGVFKKSKILKTAYYGPGMPKPEGSVLTVRFVINGQEFLALNAGAQYQFNPSISIMVPCKTQKEIDTLWKKLTDGGKEIQCGWLTDKYGLCWQIVPAILDKIVEGKDKTKSARVLKALMPMMKLDIKALKQAAAGKG
jgi:predicted 3-demethylubiquinone-9 3-methyltransferase (glyoxalase superfamily)